MVTRLLVVRHGNTFDQGDTVLRVGRRTDLPLSSSGRDQAKRLGAELAEAYGSLEVAFTGTLRRTIETAELIGVGCGVALLIEPLAQFDEVDYGPDEGRPEQEVVQRLGQDALVAWDERAIPPPGWLVNPEALTAMWNSFLGHILQQYPNRTAMVVTSNGVARFAPPALANHATFLRRESLKLRTCGYWEFQSDVAHRRWIGVPNR